MLYKRVGAEFIGTYALVTAGCGAIIVNTLTGQLNHVGVAFTFGLVITVMIAAMGHISGGHFNPAVTLSLALIRHFKWQDVPFYVGGQVFGAIMGALTLKLIFGDVAQLGTNMPSGTALQSFWVEILLTAFLVFVISAVATDKKASGTPAALAIGFTILLDALWGGPISGASMNPARSFGPALVAGVWENQWVYWIAPLIGGAVGALLYQLIRDPKSSQ